MFVGNISASLLYLPAATEYDDMTQLFFVLIFRDTRPRVCRNIWSE